MADPGKQFKSGPLVSQFAGDPDMAELVGLFLSELPDRIDALRSAWETRELGQLRRMAHQLKGAGAGYGFAPIGDAAAKLEKGLAACKGASADAPLDSLSRQLSELVDLCTRACAGGR